MHSDVATAYLRWAFLRSACARGWWLATALYLVVVAELSASELVLIGTGQGIAVVLTEVPAGVLADTVSRRLALVLAHVVSGTGMVLAGFVTSFPALVLANCLWGVGWAFASGADVAWITDELDRPARIDRVLAAQGRWDLLGSPVGIAAAGLLAWATSLSTAMVATGASMFALAVVVARWPERRRARLPARNPWRSSGFDVLQRGLALARTDRVILAVVGATLLLNGGHEGYGRLYERRLIALGLPASPDPVVWFTVLGLATVAVGAVLLRIVETRIETPDVARRAYGISCFATAASLTVFAVVPDLTIAVMAALVMKGVASIPRVAATIRVNRRTPSPVRATVHSLLSWSENVGEIVFGVVLAVVAATTSATVAMLGAALLFIAAGTVGTSRS